MSSPFATKRMLGVDFFLGTAAEAVAHVSKNGGLVVAPAAPSFIALQDDPDYRCAIADADLAIADSGWAVLLWRLLRHEKLTRVSGLALFKALLETADARTPRNLFFILPSEKAKTKTLEFARTSVYPITADDCYVAPYYGLRAQPLAEGEGRVRVEKTGTPRAGIEDPADKKSIGPHRNDDLVAGDKTGRGSDAINSRTITQLVF